MTTYHPQANQTELVKRTIKAAIRTCVGHKHRYWDLHLPLISFALRIAPHQSTGDTPAFLWYGRDLNTPLDLGMSPSPGCVADSVSDYKMELTSTLHVVYDHVRGSLANSQDAQKKHYDKKQHRLLFHVGDLVRLKAHPQSDASAGFTAKLAPVYKRPKQDCRSDVRPELQTDQSSRWCGGWFVTCCPFSLWMNVRKSWRVHPYSWLKLMYRTEEWISLMTRGSMDLTSYLRNQDLMTSSQLVPRTIRLCPDTLTLSYLTVMCTSLTNSLCTQKHIIHPWP